MQLFSRKKAILALSIGALSALGACGDDVTVTETVLPVTVTITPPSATMNIGESLNFAVSINGGSATTPPTLATCTSSNAAVATAAVASGSCRVTAVASGNITVTAAATTGQQAAASVSVSPALAAISNLTVSPTLANMVTGQKTTITPNVQKAVSAVAVAYAYASSSTAVATVATTGEITAVAPGTATITTTATGTLTNFGTTVLTATTTVNVTSAPTGIGSLTVQPSSLTMSVGQVAPLAAVATYITGSPVPTITFGTNNPAIATVVAVSPNPTPGAGVGTVTAVAPGSAVITVTATSAASGQFAASTVTQLVPVTVSPSASVTILDLRQGPVVTGSVDQTDANGARMAGIMTAANPQVDQSIDQFNVRDQIEVIATLKTNGQKVDSAVIYITAAGAPAITRKSANKQIFSGGIANDGPILLLVNTANFTADYTAGTSDVSYPNGPKVISISVFTSDASGANPREVQNATYRETVNFNNVDGYAAQYKNPTRVANNPANGFNWWGGPGADGAGSATIVPVFYTAGRVPASVTLGMRQGLTFTMDICDQSAQSIAGKLGQGISQETFTAAPFKATYNNNLGRMTASGSNAATTNWTSKNDGIIECLGYEHPPVQQQNIVGVVAGIDNQNNPAPIVTFADGYRFSAAVPRPVANRLDYNAPTAVEPDIRRASPAVTGWVNAAFVYGSNTDASTDAGVGTAGTRNWFYQGNSTGSGSSLVTLCGDTTWVAMPTASGADIPECASNAVGGWDAAGTPTGAYNLSTRANSPYRVLYTEADRLTNTRTSPKSQPHGVDKTVPVIRFSTASREDTAIVTVLGSTTSFQAEFLDERGGFVDAGDVGAPTKSSSGTIGAISATTRSQSHFAARAGAFNTNVTTTKATCINPNSITPLLASNGSTLTGGTTFLTAPTCGFVTPTSAIGGILADGYRIGHAATLEVNDGLYNYQTRVTDRAGNVSAVIGRRLAVSGGVPSGLSLLMPVLTSATTVPAIGFNAQDNVEIRAQTIANSFAQVPTSTWLRYPQALLDARFNDFINSPVTAASASIPVATPFVLGIANSFAGVPAFVTNASMNVWNVANAGIEAQGTYTNQGLAALTSFDAQFTAGTYTSWLVTPSRDAGFNAPAGLKAQLVSNSNVSNQAFVRVDFFRLAQNEAGTFDRAHWQYLGSSTSAASADQGSVRYWTFTLADENYAAMPNAYGTKQAPATTGDQIIAVGVRANGAGLVTATTVMGSSQAGINLTVNGLPTGVNAAITVTGPSFSQNVTGSGLVLVPANGTYSVNAGVVTSGAFSYVPSQSTTSVIVNGTIVPATVTYQQQAAQIALTVAGLVSGSGSFTISNIPSGGSYTANYSQANGLQNITVPLAGTYTITATSPQSINGLSYNVTLPGPVVVSVGSTPTPATVTFTNTTFRVNTNVTGLVTGQTSPTITCTGGTQYGPVALVNGGTTHIVGNNTSCSVTAPSWVNPATGFTHVGTVTNSPVAPVAGAGVVPVITVAYAVVQPRITVNMTSIGGGTNNLPNGIPFTVRVSSSAYSATGGFQDFSGVTGTSLVINVPTNGTYNVSINNSLTLTSQQWQIAAATDITSAGGLTAGTSSLVPPNAVVSNIVLGPSGTPVTADFQTVITMKWTGPLP